MNEAIIKSNAAKSDRIIPASRGEGKRISETALSLIKKIVRKIKGATPDFAAAEYAVSSRPANARAYRLTPFDFR